jgi:predicted Zn-dependent protease with MMP-like domain
MTKENFEKTVAKGIDAIPQEFMAKISNVVITIEDNPTVKQLKKLKIRSNWTLFGLYEGIPQVKRNSGYNAVLPDKITIFKIPIEKVARDEKEIIEIVRNTVWHEIAHHFGMSEGEVREAEQKKHTEK